MKVLIVNPDEQGRSELVRVLKEESLGREMVVQDVAGAAEALRLFSRGHPDLMLISTDNMAGVGREIARYVRNHEGNRHTGIVFVDSRPMDDSTLSVECLEMGADDYLRHGCSTAELMARLRAVLRLKAMTDELRSANHKLHLLSLTDELTGLANMRSFNQRYGEMLRDCRGGAAGLGVLMIDLDHFKSVNDSTNHLVGSYVISEVGRLIRHLPAFSPHHVAARFGGDEFIIASEAVSLKELSARAEVLRAAVAAAAFERDGYTVRITASIGVAWVERGFRGRAEDLIKAADLMLYRSKNSGRDNVSGMVLKYPVDLGHEHSLRLARRGSMDVNRDGDAEPRAAPAKIAGRK